MRKKTLYVEFNGVPGCGKSTICKALLDEMDEYNFRYYDYQKLFLNFIRKKMWKIRALFMLFSLNGIRIFHNTHKAMKLINLSRENRRFIPYLILTQLLIIHFAKRYSDGILVSDEGIIQYTISTLYDQKITDESYLGYVLVEILQMTNYMDVLVINVEIDLELAISRIQTRQNGKSRLDFLDNNSFLEHIINVQMMNFILIRKYISCFPHVNISARTDIEKNVDILLGKVMKRQGNEADKTIC